MRIYIASDHAGYVLKEALIPYIETLIGRDRMPCEVIDLGPFTFDPEDDYPDYVLACAHEVAEERVSPGTETAFGIVIGASGQGEAMAANRVPGVRAAVYYGEPRGMQTDAGGKTLSMLGSVRTHNDANILSLGARFLTEEEAKEAVRLFLATPFSAEERHLRRIRKF